MAAGNNYTNKKQNLKAQDITVKWSIHAMILVPSGCIPSQSHNSNLPPQRGGQEAGTSAWNSCPTVSDSGKNEEHGEHGRTRLLKTQFSIC